MAALLWLHIAAIIFAFALLPGFGIVLRYMAAKAGPDATRSMFANAGPLLNAGGAAVGLAIVSGLILARPFGYLQVWLLGTYALTLVTGILANTIDAPWAKRLAATNDTDYASVRDEAFPRIAIYVYVAAWLVILWLNIARPGSGA